MHDPTICMMVSVALRHLEIDVSKEITDRDMKRLREYLPIFSDRELREALSAIRERA